MSATPTCRLTWAGARARPASCESEPEPDLRLDRARILIVVRHTEAGASRLEPGLNQVAAGVVWKVRRRRRIGRARQVHLRVAGADDRLVRRVEDVQPELDVLPA